MRRLGGWWSLYSGEWIYCRRRNDLYLYHPCSTLPGSRSKYWILILALGKEDGCTVRPYSRLLYPYANLQEQTNLPDCTPFSTRVHGQTGTYVYWNLRSRIYMYVWIDWRMDTWIDWYLHGASILIIQRSNMSLVPVSGRVRLSIFSGSSSISRDKV